MGVRKRALAAIAVLCLIASIGVIPTAHAATSYDIAIGAFLGDLPAESMAFFPGSIDVHQGDTLRFSTQGFHTATAIPEGEDVSDWVDDNASSPGQPYFLMEPDPDDGASSVKYNLDVLLPSSFECGPQEAPCSYDGTEVLNSGAPIAGPLDFATQVDAPAGSAFWFLCLIHPSMKMRVHVVDDAEPATEQSDIDAAAAERIALDTDDAEALHEALSTKRSSRMVGGQKVWDAWSGFDTKRFSLLAMYPRKLTVKKGEKVRWHFGQLDHEVHTVSLPADAAFGQIVGQDFAFGCDPDGDAGPGPDGPPELDDFPFCADPSQLEVDAADLLFPAHGNGVWKGNNDLEHSGVLGGIPLAAADDHFTVKMNSTTGKKGVPYICAIHPFMEGKVRVKK